MSGDKVILEMDIWNEWWYKDKVMDTEDLTEHGIKLLNFKVIDDFIKFPKINLK